MTASRGPQPDSASPPPTSFLRLCVRLGGGWTLFTVCVAAVAWSSFLWNTRDAARLERDGIETQGRVWSEVVGYGRRNENNRQSYSVRTSVEFEDESGETFSRSHTHSVSTRPTFSAPRPIPVRYWREDPRVFEAGRIGAKTRYATIGKSMGVASLLCAVGLIAWYGHRALGALRVRDRGRRLKVKVRRPPDGTKDRDYRKIHWKTDEDLLGMSLPFPKKRALPRPGTVIRVYTDGKQTWWEGDVGSPKVG